MPRSYKAKPAASMRCAVGKAWLASIAGRSPPGRGSDRRRLLSPASWRDEIVLPRHPAEECNSARITRSQAFMLSGDLRPARKSSAAWSCGSITALGRGFHLFATRLLPSSIKNRLNFSPASDRRSRMPASSSSSEMAVSSATAGFPDERRASRSRSARNTASAR
jgi:hypothetical protein